MPEQAGPRVLELWGSREQRLNVSSRRLQQPLDPEAQRLVIEQLVVIGLVVGLFWWAWLRLLDS